MFKIRNVVPICSGRLRDFPSYGLWHCSIFWLVSWSNMALAATAHLGFAGIYARQTNKWLVTYVVSICWKLKMLWHILCVSVTGIPIYSKTPGSRCWMKGGSEKQQSTLVSLHVRSLDQGTCPTKMVYAASWLTTYRRYLGKRWTIVIKNRDNRRYYTMGTSSIPERWQGDEGVSYMLFQHGNQFDWWVTERSSKDHIAKCLL